MSDDFQNGYCHNSASHINSLALDAEDLVYWLEGIKQTKVLTFAKLRILEDIVKHMETAIDLTAIAMDDHIAEMDDGSDPDEYLYQESE